MTIESDIAALTTTIRVCTQQRNRLMDSVGEQAILDLPWSAALDLSLRSRNLLEREGVTTLRDLASRSQSDLLDLRGFGARVIDEIARALRRVGLGLAREDLPGVVLPRSRGGDVA